MLLLEDLRADLQAERTAALVRGLFGGGGGRVPSIAQARDTLDEALAAPMRPPGGSALSHDFRIAYGFEVN